MTKMDPLPPFAAANIRLAEDLGHQATDYDFDLSG
jgi:hypothetical protein